MRDEIPSGSGDVAAEMCSGERVARMTGSEAKTLDGTGRAANFDGELDDLHRFQLTGKRLQKSASIGERP